MSSDAGQTPIDLAALDDSADGTEQAADVEMGTTLKERDASPTPLSQADELEQDAPHQQSPFDDGSELIYVDEVPAADINLEAAQTIGDLPSAILDQIEGVDGLNNGGDHNNGDLSMIDASPQGSTDDIDLLRQQIKQLKEQLHSTELAHDEDLHDQSLRTQKLEDDIKQANQREARLQQQNEQLQTELENSRKELANLKEIVDRHTAIDDSEDARVRVEDLESEKRDLLNVVASLEAEKAELQDTANFLRNQHTATTASLRSAELSLTASGDAERTARLRCGSLEAELAIVTKDRDWHKQELAQTEASAKSQRQERHTQIVQLSSQLETASQRAETASHALESLKTSHNTLETRLTETLGQLAELRGLNADAEATFQTDMAAQRHLVHLLTKRDEEGRQRLEAVESEWQSARDSIDTREQSLNDALNKERERCERLEAKVTELRQLNEMRHTHAQSPTLNGDETMDSAVFATPRSTIAPQVHSLGLSPAASLAARMQRGGRSYTDVYSDYVRLEAELGNEKAEVARLTECLGSILADIEDRAPILREQRQEYERAIDECRVLATELAQVGADRDSAQRRADNAEAESSAAKRDARLTGQSLRDLGRQMRELVRVLAATQDPNVANDLDYNLDQFEDSMHAIATSSLAESDTDSLITAELVTFKSVSQLQANNQKLLRIAREMGRQMEEQDLALKERIERTENDAVKEAHELVLSLRDEVQSSRVNADAVSRERDMLRRLVTSQTPSNALARSNGPSNSTSDDHDTRRQLAESQAAFEAYRTEITQDMQQLKSDLSKAQRECRDAEVASAKAQSQMDFLRERLRMANESQERTNSETAQLNKSMARLQANLAKQDDAVYQVNEQVLSLRSERDRLSNEVGNLRSERDVWKATEARVTAENASLHRERAQLSDLMRNLQSMQNEIERTSNDSRSRLEEQVQKLSASLDDARARLNQESAAHRQLVLKREVETKELRDKRESIANELASTREALSIAKSSQTHLEQRIIDLTSNIAAKEDKLAIYEGRSTGANSIADQSLSREQQLELELAELRASLRAAQVEVQQTKTHIEQYKAISEANENALASLSATYDEFKGETEAQIAQKDTALAELRERVDSLSADLTTSSTEISSLHEELAKRESLLRNQVSDREQEMRQLKEAAESAQAEQAAARADLSVQAQAAAEAHQKYENELIAHAEDVRALSTFKEEMARVKAELSKHSESAKTSEANLVASKSSWEAQRNSLQKELDDVRKRFDDLRSQNSVLHDHLNEVTAQATKIQRANIDAIPANGDAGDSSHQMSQVVQFLRNEQDILEMQLHIEKQEKARLSAKLEHTERTLDETRAQLTEERNAASQSTSLNVQHDELLAKVTQLSILRESNDTLRAESQRHSAKVRTLSEQVQRLNGELVPLRGQVASLQAEIEARDGHIRLLNEDNARWKARNEQVLAKYERIDPAELQTLKDDVERLTSENERLSTLRDENANQLANVQSEMRQELADITAQRDQLQTEITSLQEQMQESQSNTEAANAEQEKMTKLLADSRTRFQNLQGTARSQRDRITSLETEVKGLQTSSATDIDSQRDSWQQEKQALEATFNQKIAAANAETAQIRAECETLRSAKETLENRIKELEGLLQAATEKEVDQSIIDAHVNKKLLEVQMASAADDPDEERKNQLEQLRTSMESEKEQAIAQATSALETSHSDRVAAFEKEIAELRSKVDAATASTEKAIADAVEEALSKAKDEPGEVPENNAQLAALQEELTKTKETLSTVQKRLAQAQKQLVASKENHAKLETTQKELEQQLEASKSSTSAEAPDETGIQARIDSAVSQVKEESEAALKARDEEHQNALIDAKKESDTRLATFKGQLGTQRATTTKQALQIKELQAELASLKSTSETPAPATSSPNVLNIRGKASEIPPPPQPSTAQPQKVRAVSGGNQLPPTPAPGKAVRGSARGSVRGRGAAGRGAGRGALLGNALQAASESAASASPAVVGSPGGPAAGKRARAEDDATASGDDSVKRARSNGPVTRAQNS